MTPSKYQTNVFQWIREACAKRDASLVIDAKAGSGKTTTIVKALEMLPNDHRALFLAFNKHIAEELKKRVPKNVSASTMNSYGWGACRGAVKGVVLNQYKTDDVVREIVADPKKARSWAGPIRRLMGLKKANPLMAAADILARYDIEAPLDEGFMEAATAVWKRITKMRNVMDFDDQIFFPVHDKMALPQYDWVFVDECQDLSQVQIDLLKRIAPRIVAVGDPNQAIYGFRGADPDAVDKIIKGIGANVLPLSICYRCPKAVVREAQKIVPTIEWSETAEEGKVDGLDLKKLRESVKAKDWILCRTTAPLVKECLAFIVAGIKATVKGRDIGEQIVSFVDKIADKSDGMEIHRFMNLLTDFAAAEKSRLDAAGRDAQIQSLEDKVESVHALSEGAKTVGDVKARIRNVFSDVDSPGVNFSTVHRSKGLEANNIFILRPDLMPFPKAKEGWQMQQEMNLKYVAITRAQKQLIWVNGGAK